MAQPRLGLSLLFTPSLVLDFTKGSLPLGVSFSRGSIGTSINAAGQLVTASANTPRFEYAGGVCKGLLMEPAVTNYCTYSNGFEQSVWSGYQSTVTPNAILSPDGTTNGAMLSINQGYFKQAITVPPNTVCTFSFWAKRGTLTNAIYHLIYFDPNNGYAYTELVGRTNYYNQLNSDTWTRITIPFTSPVSTSSVHLYPYDGTGSEVGTMYLYGAQVEAGLVATSYIPADGSSVSRLADSCSVAAGSWYRAAGGTLHCLPAGGASLSNGLQLNSGYTTQKVRFYPRLMPGSYLQSLT